MGDLIYPILIIIIMQEIPRSKQSSDDEDNNLSEDSVNSNDVSESLVNNQNPSSSLRKMSMDEKKQNDNKFDISEDGVRESSMKINPLIEKEKIQKSKKQKRQILKCTLCREQGKKNQLKNCNVCKKLFHLSCLPSSLVPKKYKCEKCKFNTREEGKMPIIKDADQEVVEIDKMALHKNQKEKRKLEQIKKYNEFLERYPYYNNDGKVRYPIQDKLLLIYKDIFEYNEKRVIPTDHPIIPNHLLGDFLQIQNFFSTFQEQLSQETEIDYKKNISYILMDCVGIDQTFKSMQGCLLKIYLKDVLERNKTDNVKVLNQNSLFAILQNLKQKDKLDEDFLKDVADEVIKFLGEIPSMKKAFEFFSYPTQLNLKTKIYVLKNLISGLSEIDQFHQFVSRRSDKIQEMTKSRGDLVSQLKNDEAQDLSNKEKLRQMTFENEQLLKSIGTNQNSIKNRQNQKKKYRLLKLANQRQKSEAVIKGFKDKIANINRSLSFITSEILFLGLDRNLSEYFFYVKDPHIIYVKFREFIFSEEDSYFIYQGKQKIIQFTKTLCCKGIHEKRLYENILSLIKQGVIRNRTLEEQQKECVSNKIGQNFIEKPLSLKYIIQVVCEVERQFSKYLLIRGYEWASQQNRVMFLSKFQASSTIQEIKMGIKTFHDQFLFVEPIKQSFQQKEDNSQQKEQLRINNHNYGQNGRKKIPMRIWGINSDKIKKYWIDYLEMSQSISGLWICASIFRDYVMDYIERKLEYQRSMEKKTQKNQKLKERQRLKRMDKQRERQERERAKQRQQRSRSRSRQRYRSITPEYQKKSVMIEHSSQKEENSGPNLRKSKRINGRKLNMDSDMEDQSNSQNEDVCQICNEFGDMICCDTCPKVFHLNCLKIKEIPEGHWSCLHCLQRISNQRQTRSRNRKPYQ